MLSADREPEHLGVEPHRGLEIGHVEHDVAELAELEHDGLLAV